MITSPDRIKYWNSLLFILILITVIYINIPKNNITKSTAIFFSPKCHITKAQGNSMVPAFNSGGNRLYCEIFPKTGDSVVVKYILNRKTRQVHKFLKKTKGDCI